MKSSHQKSIAKSLVVKIILTSALLTTLFTAITMFNDYKLKQSNLKEGLSTIEELSLDGVSKALWDMDDELLKVQASSLLKVKEIIGVTVIGNGENLFQEKKSGYEKYTSKFIQKMQLKVKNGENSEVVGTLNLEVTEDFIQDEMFNSITSFLIFQGVKTFIISFIIIFILNRYLISHMTKITNFFTSKIIQKNDDSAEPELLNLRSSKSGDDEIDIMVSAVNEVVKTNFKFLKEQEERLSLQSSLEAAEVVQESLLPGKNRDIPGVIIKSSYKPAEQTGGDWYYHFYDEHNNMAYFFCGDVTGHGIPSALLTAVCCGNILGAKAYAKENEIITTEDMEVALRKLAESLNESVLATGAPCKRLMTMAMMSFNLETGTLTFLNAGHNHPFWFSKSQNKIRTLTISGTRLGFTEEPLFKVKSYQLEPGDRVFLFTDGLIENTGPQGEVLKDTKLKKSLIDYKDLSLVEIHDSIMSHAQDIWKGHTAADDITTLFIEYTEKTMRKKLKAA